MIERLAIVGVGLLGGSLALAARAQGLAREIVGIGRDRGRLETPLRAGALDRLRACLPCRMNLALSGGRAKSSPTCPGSGA